MFGDVYLAMLQAVQKSKTRIGGTLKDDDSGDDGCYLCCRISSITAKIPGTIGVTSASTRWCLFCIN